MAITIAKKPSLPTRLVFIAKEAVKEIPDFAGDRDEITVRYEDGKVIILIGLGPQSNCAPAILRSAAAQGIQKVIDLKRSAVSMILPDNLPGGKNAVSAIIEGALLGNYRFAKYKTEKPVLVSKFECVGAALPAADLRRIEADALVLHVDEHAIGVFLQPGKFPKTEEFFSHVQKDAAVVTDSAKDW